MAGESKPKVKVFACTQCGAAVTLRNLNSLSAACPQCHAVMDVTNDQYKILFDFEGRSSEFPIYLDFGMRGKLLGRTWEVIGFVARRDNASSYIWHEYLLFNPYYGYRWLTEDRGNWMFVTPIKEKPATHSDSSSTAQWSSRVSFAGDNYRLYNRGVAEVIYVAGEFYWKLETGDIVQMDDYISPPYMLSRESDGDETVWALSQYISSQEIKDAFKAENVSLKAYTVSPVQLSPMLPIWQTVMPFWFIFAVLITVMQVLQAGSASNTVEFDQNIPYQVNTKVQDYTTPTFVVTKDKSNLELHFDASGLDNSWLWLAGELVNDTTGDTYTFERSLEYYHGYTDGENWSEGSWKQDLLMSQIPGGTYYINLDYESGDFKSLGQQVLHVSVVRNVPMYANYFWCLFLLSCYPLSVWGQTRAYEVARWSNSDYSPYVSNSE